MEIRKQKRIPLACRYVPYDQWFLTHVDPTWKIKQLKQFILAKCFSLPFDPRRANGRNEGGSRAPSPITFAPDEGHRPISPIKFANPQELRKKKSMAIEESTVGHGGEVTDGEQGRELGSEEDDEWDDEWEGGEEENDDDDGEDEEPIPGGRIGSFPPVAGLPAASGRIGALPQPPPAPVATTPPKRKRRFNPLSKIGARDRAKSKEKKSRDFEPKEEEGIQTSWFTLLRFATGQVLEEDFPISWYDFMPHELVELHNVVPPANFAVGSALSQLIYHATITHETDARLRPKHVHAHSYSGGMVKSGVITTSADVASALASALLIPSSANNPPAPMSTFVPPPSSPLTMHRTLRNIQHALIHTQPAVFTPLLRTDLDAYAKPYWEGWVRTLRKVIRQPPPTEFGFAGRSFDYPNYMGGGGGGFANIPYEVAFGGAAGIAAAEERMRLQALEKKGKGKESVADKDGRQKAYDGWREGRDREKGSERSKPKYEWRERWLVIRDDTIFLYRNRGDTAPYEKHSLLPVIAIRSADYLRDSSFSSRSKHRTRSTDRARTRTNTRPQEHHRRSASQPRAGSSLNPRDSSGKNTGSSHNISRTKAGEGIEEVPRDPAQLRQHGSSSTTTNSFERRSHGSTQQRPPATEAEIRAAKERELKREQDRAKELERRRMREKQERELESLRKWDDISLSFPFGSKSKDKGKGKEKEKDKGKDNKDDKRRATHDNRGKDAGREEEMERERARERERERERRRREYEGRDFEQERDRNNERTYIPTSRDEAESAGMRIICARLPSGRPKERQRKSERERYNALSDESYGPTWRYTNTGPSLSGPIVHPPADDPYDSSGGALKDNWKKLDEAHLAHVRNHGYMNNFPPRKSSLPGLSLSAATSGQGLSRHDSKFGMGGLFGKDKEVADDQTRKAKDDKKRKEKERRAREKEQKELEKERKKAKKREEEEEEDFGVNSGLSWNVGKHAKSNADTMFPDDTRNQSKGQSVPSLATAETSTIQAHDSKSSVATSSAIMQRPKLSITPSASAQDRPEKAGSDSGSSLSISSPVFAHSTDSEDTYDEDDIYGFGRPRRGYRYGGYQPSPAKAGQKPAPAPPTAPVEQPKTVQGSHVAKVAGIDHSKFDKESDDLRGKTRHNERNRGKSDVRGEWVVFDMGSDQAFQSILRILHRLLLDLSASDFLPPSITAPIPVVEPHPVGDARVTKTEPPAADNSNIDDIYVPASEQPTIAPQKPRHAATHPEILTNLVTKQPHQGMGIVPGLPYPEWRYEVVHRARSYGTREAGRPLDIARYGWGLYVPNMDTSPSYAKLRQKEELMRQKVRDSISILSDGNKTPSLSLSWNRDGSEDDADVSQNSGEDSGEDEDPQETRDWDASEYRRRMSSISHVSTIKAPATSASTPTNASPIEDNGDGNDSKHTSGDTSGTERDDTESVISLHSDEYEGIYTYGQEDEEGALAEGLGSIVNDSDEESEVEWFAWSTDILRQNRVRREEPVAERGDEIEVEEEDETLFQSLSPIEFASPVALENGPVIRRNVATPTAVPPIPLPKTPDEERRQYADKRRKMEPRAISTSFSPPPVPPLPKSPYISSMNYSNISHQASASTSNIQTNALQHSQYPAQGGYHLKQYSVLSSPASPEPHSRPRNLSMRNASAPVTINTGLANASSRNHSNPMSPSGGGFSSTNDEDFDPSSVSNTPPSATGDFYAVHRRGHSRSISGSLPTSQDDHSGTPRKSTSLMPGRSTLHHSTSMPLSIVANSRPMFAGSPPHSPTRMSAAKTLTQPISMPILTAAQISQIEAETEAKMLHQAQQRYQNEMTHLSPSPSISPPSSYGHSPSESSNIYATVPRRTSSTNMAVTSPSSSVSATFGRSSSIHQRPLPVQPDRLPEKGILRKKRSDLGTGSGGNEVDRDGELVSPRQRPTLSLLGLSGNSSRQNTAFSDVQSPTQQQHPRGPRSAHPHMQVHRQAPPSTPPSTTFQSAKALLRRVRSGSSLRVDHRIDEVSPFAESGQAAWIPRSPPPSGVFVNAPSTSQAGGSGSSSRNHDPSTPPPKKKLGPMDRIVRGLDSALDFVDPR